MLTLTGDSQNHANLYNMVIESFPVKTLSSRVSEATLKPENFSPIRDHVHLALNGV